MKTTVEVPDKLYRQIKAHAALKGQTIKTFFVDALRDKLTCDQASTHQEAGWKAVFGKANKREVAEVQRIVDREFSRVEPEHWD